MSELADFLHKLIDAIDRPADHPAAELHQEVDAALAGEEEAPAPSPEAEPAAPEPPAEDSAEVVEPDLAAQPEPPVDG